MAVRAKTKPRLNERYEQRRLEVLRAAAKTFSIRGFHVATLDDVAEELGVTKPALYYYARSKDELMLACAQMALEALEKPLDHSTMPDAGPVEQLRRFFAFYAQTICDDFGRCLILTEPRELSPAPRKVYVAARRKLNQGVRDIIREGIATGVFKPCDDLALASAMFDAFNGLTKWFDMNGTISLTRMTEHYLEIFLNGAVAGKPPHAPRVTPMPKSTVSKQTA